MKQENLQSPCPKKDKEKENIEGEIFDAMSDEKEEMLNEIFSFKNVLLTAVAMGTFILICYGVGLL